MMPLLGERCMPCWVLTTAQPCPAVMPCHHALPPCLQRKSRVAYFYDPDIGQYYYGALG